MRMTVSLCVIMVEITNNLKLLPLIMLVLLISKVFPYNILCATPSNTMYITYLSFHRLLVMLLMKGFMKNKLD